MKKSTLVILSVILLVAVIATGLIYYLNQHKATNDTTEQSVTETTTKDVRQMIWNKLPADQKERVNGSWQNGTLSTITLDKSSASWLNDESLDGKEVYMVDFPTKNTGVPNNMLICADKITYEYLGNLPVD